MHIHYKQAGLHQTCLLSQLSDSPSIKCNVTERDLQGDRLQLLAAVGSTACTCTLINYQQDSKLWISLSIRKGTALIHIPISAWFKCAHFSNFQKLWCYVRKPGCGERCTGGTNTFQLPSLLHLVSLCCPPFLQEPAVIHGFT